MAKHIITKHFNLHLVANLRKTNRVVAGDRSQFPLFSAHDFRNDGE